jgi:hypothetical protein
MAPRMTPQATVWSALSRVRFSGVCGWLLEGLTGPVCKCLPQENPTAPSGAVWRFFRKTDCQTQRDTQYLRPRCHPQKSKENGYTMATAVYSSLPTITFRTTPSDVTAICALRVAMGQRPGSGRVSTTDVIRAALAEAAKTQAARTPTGQAPR